VTSCFEPDGYKKNVGEAFKFSNCSDNFDRCEWNFGDGNSSTISEPSHVYTKPGSYDVQLTTFRKRNSSERTKRVIAAREVILATTLSYSNKQYDENEDNCYGAIYAAHAGEPNFTEYTGFQSNGSDRPALLEIPIQTLNTNYRLRIVYNINGGIKRDSVTIENIDPFKGPKIPSGSKSMPGLFDLSYTVNVLYK
jgi:hypothetical protein